MSATCQFNGRLGNTLINMCQVIAYCKQHNLQWNFPKHGWAFANGQVSISVPDTGPIPVNPITYNEPHDSEGRPYYHEIPFMENVMFTGYYQSPRYFDEHRQFILDTINLPWVPDIGIVGVHSRRGDCLVQPDAFPIAPREYYQAAIKIMQQKGFNRFRIYGDDILWQKQEYLQENYPGCTFEFREEHSDIEDFISLSGCEGIITARSTFSLMAGWFNRLDTKIVLCPSLQQDWWWHSNRNLLDSSFLTQVHW